MLDIEVWEEAHKRGARTQPLAAINNRVVLYGYSVRETAGAAAQVLILNGADASGLEVVGINLNPNESIRDWLGDRGIVCDVSLFVVKTGTVTGSLYVKQEP